MKRNVILSVAAAFALSLGAHQAMAQTSTTGAVRGVVKDASTGEPIVGATVVATSRALQGQQAEITDGSGSYTLANLPPGTYEVTVYFSDARFSRSNVLIRLGKTAQVNISIDPKATGGEIIRIEGTAPIIDQGSTKTGITINQDYTDNVPTGRTFGAVLGAAAGSQGDLYGVSFSGSTSVENVYIIEGINTTDPAFGLLSSNLPNEFVRETEVITGGYNAE
ncbi:MAG TPA: carboxypeptidase-like regulatory domain-containing protein, partial [Kofleriaceae bacterium]|nr:carboxypeptidase-like regulatory domain-containing protein [Kofleriaceae bacterium]